MKTYGKIIEIAYLVLGGVFIVDGITRLSEEAEKGYLSIGFGVLAICMFFFKRKFRKKRE